MSVLQGLQDGKIGFNLYCFGLPLCIFALLLLAACSRELDPDQIFAGEHELFISCNPNGDQFPETSGNPAMHPTDSAWYQLQTWFSDNRAYWQQDECEGQYANFWISGYTLKIFIYETLICVGFNNTHGHFRQYTRSAHPEDFQFLRQWCSNPPEH